MNVDAMGILNLVDHELTRLPAANTASFVEAREMQPETIIVESNPSTFHQYSHSNIAETASLLACYWDQRKRLFGSKALLPLLAASQGRFGEAVTSDDMTVLQSGFVQVLPRDSSGRRLVFIDLSVQLACPVETLKRATFLVLQGLIGDSTVSSCTIALILHINEAFGARDFELLKWTCSTVTNVMPLSLARLHLLKTSEDPLPSLTFPAVGQLVREGLLNEVTFTASRGTPDLQAYGISSSELPAVLQGDFQWDPKVLLGTNASEKRAPAATRPFAEPATRLPTASQIELKEQLSGTGGTADLSEAQSVLGQSSEDSKPKARVANHEMLDCNDEPSTERHRTRNAVYSRRKYLRKKIEFEVLETESTRLQTENAELKREEKRLEDLLRAALQEVEKYHRGALASTPAPRPTGQQQDPASPDTSASANRSAPFHTGVLEQQLASDPAALLALGQARLREQVVGASALDYIAREQPALPGQANFPYLLSTTIQQELEQLGRSNAGMTLPLLPEGQRRLLPSSLPLASPFPSGIAAPPQAPSIWAGQSEVNIFGRVGRQLTEDDIQRFLQDRLRDGEAKRGF